MSLQTKLNFGILDEGNSEKDNVSTAEKQFYKEENVKS